LAKRFNNWMQSTATVPATFSSSVTGTDPGFVNRATRDVHLTVASACRNRGLNALVYWDGTGAARAGLPTLEYVTPLQSRPRPSDGQLDLGAYEYGVPAFSSIRISGKDCFLDFTTATNNHYDLQRTSDLTANIWSPVATNIPGTDGTVALTNTNGATQARQFYRVKVLD
jgi:hypothetical protein